MATIDDHVWSIGGADFSISALPVWRYHDLLSCFRARGRITAPFALVHRLYTGSPLNDLQVESIVTTTCDIPSFFVAGKLVLFLPPTDFGNPCKVYAEAAKRFAARGAVGIVIAVSGSEFLYSQAALLGQQDQVSIFAATMLDDEFTTFVNIFRTTTYVLHCTACLLAYLVYLLLLASCMLLSCRSVVQSIVVKIPGGGTISTADREALLQIYMQLGIRHAQQSFMGPMWHQAGLLPWYTLVEHSDYNYCSQSQRLWGIYCEHGRVIVLDCYECYPSGSISDSFSQLSALSQLAFLGQSNYLSGTVPASLGLLRNLEMLWIENEPSAGLILPPSVVGSFASLVIVKLSYVTLNSLPADFANFNSIEAIGLNNTHTHSPLPSFRKFPKMCSFEIVNGTLDSMPSFYNMSMLKNVVIRNSLVSVPVANMDASNFDGCPLLYTGSCFGAVLGLTMRCVLDHLICLRFHCWCS